MSSTSAGTSITKNAMIRVFKTSSTRTELVSLTKDTIRLNYNSGRQTNVLFDTNILIAIEAAYRSGQRHHELKQAGVYDLSKLISKNAKYGVFISPAAAYQELPPSRRSAVEAAFEKFVADYLPTFRADPNSTNVTLGDESEEPESFKSLPRDRQELLSFSYASLLAMNVIGRINGLTAIDRYKLYFDYCAENLDLVSLKELTIARYAFAPETGLTEGLRRRKVAVTKNFLKLKKGGDKGIAPSEALKRIALNGANDLKLISAADIVNNSQEPIAYGLVKHDVWIATSDEKLYEFCCACPGLISLAKGGTPARFVDSHDDIRGTSYWRESMDIQIRRLSERAVNVFQERALAPVVAAALEIEDYLDSDKATEHFRSRSWR